MSAKPFRGPRQDPTTKRWEPGERVAWQTPTGEVQGNVMACEPCCAGRWQVYVRTAESIYQTHAEHLSRASGEAPEPRENGEGSAGRMENHHASPDTPNVAVAS